MNGADPVPGGKMTGYAPSEKPTPPRLFLMRKRGSLHNYCMDQPNLLLLGDVARLVPCKPYQVVYLLTTGQLPEPALRLGGRRVFTQEDVVRIRSKLTTNIRKT